jgi:hypothetical protein
MLYGMKPIDDLPSVRANVFGHVPNPGCPITNHNPFFGGGDIAFNR